MTAPPKFGDAIPTNGKRPGWLSVDVLVEYQTDQPKSRGTDNTRGWSKGDWAAVTAIRLEVPRYDFVYFALERGFTPWFGGDEAPGDWDGGTVLTGRGEILYHVVPTSPFWNWNREDARPFNNYIGYTRKATSTALPLAHPAAPRRRNRG